MPKYLYGAAVQGIQSFIFATNTLRDVIGASELVAQICDELFDEFRGNHKDGSEYANGTSVLKAAGNIKFIFNDKAACENAVRNFPKKVFTKAPGITLSQAVVEIVEDDIDKNFQPSVDNLEAKLRACRNRQPTPVTLGLMGIERSRQTGMPSVRHEDGVAWDAAKVQKSELAKKAKGKLVEHNFGKEIDAEKLSDNIGSFTTKGNPWIAIIHIDGNGLGQIVSQIGKERATFSSFSQTLDEACCAAAIEAFNTVYEVYELDEHRNLPIRPIVLSGDDHTLICRADLAIPYVRQFLESFEKFTHAVGNGEGKLNAEALKTANLTNLTACAGIAFIKSNYPYYYGYNLAESLCEQAKKDAKNETFKKDNGDMAPSCLMFHKVQDSFVENFADIAERELTPAEGHSWCAGPYYLDLQFAKDHNRLTIQQLLENSAWLDSKLPKSMDKEEKQSALPDEKQTNAVKSTLRRWLSAMHRDTEEANQLKARMKDLNGSDKAIWPFFERLTEPVARDGKQVYQAYDVLSLHSVTYGN